jgi:FixJ family two-component response regulator
VQARLREVSPDTKVIVITGRETLAIRVAALEGGAFAFLAKPFDDETFRSLIGQALLCASALRLFAGCDVLYPVHRLDLLSLDLS